MTNFRYNCATNDFPFFNIFEETFGALNKGHQPQNKSGFPHTNVYVNEEERKLFFDIAVAGYQKEDIDISIKESVLTIKYDKFGEKQNEENIHYIEHGIAERNWQRKWTLSPQVVANSAKATFEDGILKIEFDLEKDNTFKVEIQ